jgi:hypothetical protein
MYGLFNGAVRFFTGRPRCRWADNIKIDLREDGMALTGSIWFRIGTSGGHL